MFRSDFCPTCFLLTLLRNRYFHMWFSLTLCVCVCASRVMLLNQARRSIPSHEVWRMLMAARRIYRPLQVRHVHTPFVYTQTYNAWLHHFIVLMLQQECRGLNSTPQRFQSPYYKHLAELTPSVFAVDGWHFPSLVFVGSLEVTRCVVFLFKMYVKVCETASYI